MSETREPIYLELEWNEDFKLDAHIDSDGQQRFVATGYVYKRKPDGIYRAPLIPELFFGSDGTQLETWSQYLTAGDHTILRRDSGNPSVSDQDLAWHKVSGQAPQRTPQVAPASATRVTTLEIPVLTYAVVGLVAIGALYFLYKVVK